MHIDERPVCGPHHAPIFEDANDAICTESKVCVMQEGYKLQGLKLYSTLT